MDPNYQQALAELRANFERDDLVKARAVLHCFPWQTKQLKRVFFELGRLNPEKACCLLASMLANDDPDSPESKLLFPALVEQLEKVTAFSKVLALAQSHEHTLLLPLMLTRLTPQRLGDFCKALGQRPALDSSLVEHLNLIEEEKQLILLLMMNLRPSPIAVEVAALLKPLTTPENLATLCDLVGLDAETDLHLNLVFDEVINSLDPAELVSLLNLKHSDPRGKAMARLAALDEDALEALCNQLGPDHDEDAQIHALNVLAEIGSAKAIGDIKALLFRHPENPNIRFAAYEALGRMPMEEMPHLLASGLEDEDDSVRLVVIKAIDRHYTPQLAQGLARIIQLKDEQALRVIGLIISAQCEHIFADLLSDAFFCRFSVSYLAKSVHTSIREHFLALLEDLGHDSLAADIRAALPMEVANKPLVYAVDDSQMILTIYRNMLHQLGCEVFTFADPMKAIKGVAQKTPALIFTDLNMGKVSGLQLIQNLRLRHDHQELPIYLVTTQSTESDHRAARDLGANGTLNKPFSSQDLTAILEAHHCLPGNQRS